MSESRVRPEFPSALVTGATGFIGGRLANRLAETGVVTTATVRTTSDPQRIAELSRDIDRRSVDGTADNLNTLFSDVRPQVVFHLAARFEAGSDPEDREGLVADNVGFTEAVCTASTRAGCRALVSAGTAWQKVGSTPYAETKQTAEDVIAACSESAGIASATLMIYDTYGPGDRRVRFLTALAEAARTGTLMRAVPGDQRLHMVHVDDVCDAFVHAANRLLSGTDTGHASYTLPSPATVSLHELAEAWISASGCDVEIAWGAIAYRPGAIMEPWEGEPLPGWTPRISLAAGLATLQG